MAPLRLWHTRRHRRQERCSVEGSRGGRRDVHECTSQRTRIGQKTGNPESGRISDAGDFDGRQDEVMEEVPRVWGWPVGGTDAPFLTQKDLSRKRLYSHLRDHLPPGSETAWETPSLATPRPRRPGSRRHESGPLSPSPRMSPTSHGVRWERRGRSPLYPSWSVPRTDQVTGRTK